jgi:hypothetical protein
MKAKAFIDARGSSSKKIILFDNWNEYGEGHYILPTEEFGYGYLEAIKEVFGK